MAKNNVAEKIEQVQEIKAVDAFKPNNLFAVEAAKANERIAAKVAAVNSAKQKLAEACDYYNEGGKSVAVANEAANCAAIALFKAEIDGALTKEEVSATLGDVFGYKLTSKGKPSKTPQGEGEAIRKRIVRAVAAWEHCHNLHDDKVTFFDGLPVEEIEPIVNSLFGEGHNVSIWTAYDQFQEVKKAHAERLALAFNPDKIADIVESLSAGDAADKVRDNPALVAAYGAMIEVLNIIGKLD